MQKLLLIILASVASLHAGAEDHFYLGPQATYQFWDESRFLPGFDDDNGIQLGLNVGYEFGATESAKYAAEFVAQTSGSDTNAEADVYELNYYMYGSESSFGTTPYFVAGFSHINMDPAVVIDKTTTNAVLGAGISKYLGEFLEWKTDIRFRTAIGDHAVGQVHDVGITTALNFHFGRSGPAIPAASAPAPTPPPAATPPVRVSTPAPESVRNIPIPRVEPARPAEPQVRDVTVVLNVLFETNSSVLQDLDDAEFRRMANALRDNPGVTLTIEGHTDSAGSAEYNETLSQRRATQVKEALVSRYGAPEARIRAIGYGESRPIADNETSAGRAQNRRVVGVISYQEQL